MKKFGIQSVLILFLLVTGMPSAWSQDKVMQVHRDGNVVFELSARQIDSITLKEKGVSIVPVQIAQGSLQGTLLGTGIEKIPKQSIVITTQAEWEALLSAMNKNISPMGVDFSNYRVIAVFSGRRAYGGWSVDVTAVTEYADHIVASVDNLKTGNVIQSTDQPFHLVKIPASTKRVEFQYPSPPRKHGEKSGCDDWGEEPPQTLAGTWYPVGYVNTDTEELEKPRCGGELRLAVNGRGSARIEGNETEVNLSKEQIFGPMTTMMLDPDEYTPECITFKGVLGSVRSYSHECAELKFYYNDGKNYLLYRLIE
jgi:hypothetical protein